LFDRSGKGICRELMAGGDYTPSDLECSQLLPLERAAAMLNQRSVNCTAKTSGHVPIRLT
jgi:hypothetical protein